MELLIADPSYDREGDYNQFITELKTELSTISDDFEIRHADMGHGADLPALLVMYLIFSQGKAISENIDGWISLAKKFVSMLSKFKKRLLHYRIDEDGAFLLAIERIVQSGCQISSIDKIVEKTIAVSPFSLKSPDHLDYKPLAFYLQVLEINRDYYYIFGIKSTGVVGLEYRIDASDWMGFTEG